jgi:GntR family transcriptional regulator
LVRQDFCTEGVWADRRGQRLVPLRGGQEGSNRLHALERARAGPAGIMINSTMLGNVITGSARPGPDACGRGRRRTFRLGSIGDIASAALFLATEKAGYITGQMLAIDCGQKVSESLEAIGVRQMRAEVTREPASEADGSLPPGLSSSSAESVRAKLHPRTVPDRRLVEDARDRLLDVISSGTLRPGDRVGTERELATRLSVSRSTLRQVLAMLSESGIVRSVPGRAGGTFVAHPQVAPAKVDRDLSVIVGLPEYLRRQGFVAGTQVLSATISGADDIAANNLAVPIGSQVIDIVRIRLADGVPISLERLQLPAGIFPGLLEMPLGGSIYDLLGSHYGITPDVVVEHLEVTEASSDEAPLLGVNVRAPLLAITRTSATSAGVPFEFSHDLFRADRTRVTFRTRAERAQIVQRGTSDSVVDLRSARTSDS